MKKIYIQGLLFSALLIAVSVVAVPKLVVQAQTSLTIPLADGTVMTVTDPNDAGWTTSGSGNYDWLVNAINTVTGSSITNISQATQDLMNQTFTPCLAAGSCDGGVSITATGITCANGASFQFSTPAPTPTPTPTPAPTPSGCGPGTLNDQCCTPSYTYCSGNSVYDNCGDYVDNCSNGYSCSNGSCVPSCVANQGAACNTNSCGQSGGTIQCDGSCSGVAPSESSCTPPSLTVPSTVTVNQGSSCSFTWSASPATSCSVTDSTGTSVAGGTSGSFTSPTLQASTQYTLTCKNGSTVTASQTVTCKLNPSFLEI